MSAIPAETMGFWRVPGLYKPLDGTKSRQMLTGIPSAPSKLGTSPHLLFLTSAQGQAQVERKLAPDGGFLCHIWAGLEPAGEVTAGRTSTCTAGSEGKPVPVPTLIASGKP